MKNSPAIIIDDDEEDQELIKEAFKTLDIPNEIIFFNKSKEALEFLKTYKPQPFFILCDVNMPLMDGLTLRNKINEDEQLRYKAIPFLFYSVVTNDQIVNKAYSLNIQGYFKKPTSIFDFKHLLLVIISYWDTSYQPNPSAFLRMRSK